MDAQDPLKAGRCDFLNSWQRAGGTLEISAKVSAAASSIIRCLSFLPRLDPKLLIASKPLLQSFCSFFVLKYMTMRHSCQGKSQHVMLIIIYLCLLFRLVISNYL